MTDPAVWPRLDALLDAALERPPHERRGFLDEACAGDGPMRARIEDLLRIAEAEDRDLRPGGGLEGSLAGEVLDDLAGEGDAPLAAGSRLGRFEVREHLGSGGVGRVYRALDPTLGRDVAIKALAEAFRTDPKALRRFEREARVLATVNHPNVATIHGFEIIDGAPYLVLELVEGQTLEERLARGPLPWRDATEVALQIAEALEEAHHRGVVHRDLKPSNVKLTAPGRVKVLDFGLARTMPAAGGTLPAGLPSFTTTGPGTIQGTAPYMSPEQARGLPVDGRSDVWALGCVLYEMLAGRRVFAGRTVADILTAVVRDDADWAALPSDVPPALRRLLERCLRRDVRQRLQDVGDVRLELAEVLARTGSVTAGTAPSAHGTRRGRLVLSWLVAAACAAGLLWNLLRREPARPPGRVLQISLETPGIEIDDFTASFALSPDGSTLVFTGTEGGTRRLFARAFDRLEARPLAGTEGGWQPFFSPDGQWVAFFADRKLKKVSLSGGDPLSLVEVGGNARGGTWSADGSIILTPTQTSGLSRVSAEGGRLEELTRLDAAREERSHRWPHALPGGQAVLFTVDHEGATFDEASIEALSLRTGDRRPVVTGGAYARFLPDGHLAFANAGRLYAVPFDAERLVTAGRPVQVLEGIRYDVRNGRAQMAIADDGTLVYVPGLPTSHERHLAWADASGRRTRFPGPARLFNDPRLAPQGGRIAVRVGPPDDADVWIQDIASGTLTQLTFGLRPWRPVWSRDGGSVTVGAQNGGRWRLLAVPVAGGSAQVLHEGAHRVYPCDWSPDGRFLAYQELDAAGGWDLRVLEVDGAGRARGSPQPLAATPANETNPRFSPDGRWVAYESDELDAEMYVYVAPFGRPGARVKVSKDSGRWPVWGRPGKLFYWHSRKTEMHHVTWLERAGAFHVSTDDSAWPKDVRRWPGGYDIEPSTERMLFLEETDPAAPVPPYRMTLFTGWLEDVKRRMAADAAAR